MNTTAQFDETTNKPKIIYTEKYNKDGVIENFETQRLTIRRWRSGDFQDLKELAISNNNSEFADFDHAWPADDTGIQGMLDWMEENKWGWAMEVKSASKVVGLVGDNGTNEANQRDFGHVMNCAFVDNDYEYETLAVLYDHYFKNDKPVAIVSRWVMDDTKKLEPLAKLGMKIESGEIDKAMRPNKDGVTREAEGCFAIITKEEWERANPTEFMNKNN